jgi:pyruvyl transferase EpsO
MNHFNMLQHAQMMDNLVGYHEVLLPLIANQSIHYLDVPFYGNVGDLLIMLGTLRFIEKHQLNVTRFGTYFNYAPSWATSGDVILFQGGGNFGDIYGPFQAFRERVIAALPNNRIIILPQSIHFADAKKLKKCCELLSRHQDLHICVRDLASKQIALRMTPNVYLLPDMAHQLWPIQKTATAQKPVLNLRRRDAEALTINTVDHAFDWEDLVGKPWIFFMSEIAERSIYHAHRFGLNKPFSNLQARLWINQATRFVDKAIGLFSSYERVESDRLHAHILSCLLSLPNQIADNSYGKNKRYISTWTASSPQVTLVQPTDVIK